MRKRRYTCLTKHYPLLADAPLPVIHNIVATAQITSSLDSLDLHKIHLYFPFSFYDKERFAAITIRLSSPECTALLFSSGKLVVTGGRSWYASVYSSLFIASLLGDCMPEHTFSLHSCEIQNMVAHAELDVKGGHLDLQAMYRHLGLNCTYQRNMFPGLIFRPEASPVVLLCFYSGKIVITGGKNMVDIYEGWNRLWPIVKEFVVPKPSLTSDMTSHNHGVDLEGHGVAHLARAPHGDVHEPAGGHPGGVEIDKVLDLGVLEGLGDDLAAEGPLRGLAGPLAAGRAEEGAVHGGVVEL